MVMVMTRIVVMIIELVVMVTGLLSYQQTGCNGNRVCCHGDGYNGNSSDGTA